MQEAISEREQVYRSNKESPLGKGMRRYELPVDEEQFTFGSKVEHTDTGEEAKAVLYPVEYESDGEVEDEYIKAQYAKSHGSREPGQQTTRGYRWNGANPQEIRFGDSSSADDKHVADTLKWENTNNDEYVRQHPRTGKLTKIVPKKVAEFRTKNKAVPGQAVLKQGSLKGTISDDYIFGEPSIRDQANETTSHEVIFGYMAGEDLQPDADLGKSYRSTDRIQQKMLPNTVDDQHVFGLPSIRYDKKAPKTRSLANTYNYGDELDAHGTLDPQVTYEKDLQEAKSQGYTLDEIKEIVDDLGLELEEGEAEQAFALADDFDQDGHVALEDFKLALLSITK
eukprot:TRINITY_DN7444_c1_g1_i1.p1 TRINITY_DN7444_c1_g1~~TRINITY_DN7444_c1_g1_i1.p1  ORF type:complete len:339 (-),score=119.13 TRINITY_DN7444_c1_g1_i1:57-1073(-)